MLAVGPTLEDPVDRRRGHRRLPAPIAPRITARRRSSRGRGKANKIGSSSMRSRCARMTIWVGQYNSAGHTAINNLALDLTPQIAGARVAVSATAATRCRSHPSYALCTASPCFPSSRLDRWLISLSFCDNC